MNKLIEPLDSFVQELSFRTGGLSRERKKVIEELVDYIVVKLGKNRPVDLNFICTHNSRRSQFSQIWAQVASYHYDIPNVHCYSGGVEVTAFNERAVNALNAAGFKIIKKEKGANPIYLVYYSEEDFVSMYSKVYNDALNAHENFAAIMTCSDADENCPFIPGAEVRIPLRYDDPKAFDGTALETEKYIERSLEIATELFYVFQQVKNKIG